MKKILFIFLMGLFFQFNLPQGFAALENLPENCTPFKSHHPTTETAVQLAQNAANIISEPEIQCGVCYDTILPDQHLTLGCTQHNFCAGCFKSYIEGKINDGSIKITCPGEGCKIPLQLRDDLVGPQDLAKLEKNRSKYNRELKRQENNSRAYLNKEFLKGCLSFNLCCFNCFGCVSCTKIEVCPNCKEVFQFSEGCPSIYHKKCDKVFLRNNQFSVPLWYKAVGCYFPFSISCCCSYGHDERGNSRTCSSCPSIWCVDI